MRRRSTCTNSVATTPACSVCRPGRGRPPAPRTPSSFTRRRSTTILYESLAYRQIFTDGRPLPTDPNPTWLGYSVGRWEGNTLVVSTIGYNDRTFLDDFGGHRHTEALRVTERITRRDLGHMDIEVTFEDPKAYAKPIRFPSKPRSSQTRISSSMSATKTSAAGRI